MAALKKSSIALLLVLGIMLGVNVASAQTPKGEHHAACLVL